ncbi:hypothetical protein C0992_003316 [Termitomyces sp. T32_za158]|nr:hypothetical protein C0992_003316 [Termitomyces sp. T32_za158]
MALPSNQFLLPDLLATCSLDGGVNPYYEKGAAESRAWINSYNIFTDRKRAFFVLGSNELLVSRVYNYADSEHFRTCCDFVSRLTTVVKNSFLTPTLNRKVNLLFVFDEISDEQTGKDALSTGNTFLNAMRYSDWDDRSLFSQMTKELVSLLLIESYSPKDNRFRARLVRLGPKATTRFLENWETYCTSVITEAELREQGKILEVEAFVELRRENSADIYSYDMEQSKGISGNNIITVLMKNRHLELQEASDYVGAHCKELMDLFISTQAHLPSWGASIDAEVARYIYGLGCWIKGNLE